MMMALELCRHHQIGGELAKAQGTLRNLWRNLRVPQNPGWEWLIWKIFVTHVRHYTVILLIDPMFNWPGTPAFLATLLTKSRQVIAKVIMAKVWEPPTDNLLLILGEGLFYISVTSIISYWKSDMSSSQTTCICILKYLIHTRQRLRWELTD